MKKRNILIVVLLTLALSNSYAVLCNEVAVNVINTSKDSIVTSVFTISDLGCDADAAAMQKKIAQTKGVKTCAVSASKGTVVVKYDSMKITKEEIITIIENCSLCQDKDSKPFKVKEVN